MASKKRKIGDLLRSEQAKRFRSSYDLLDEGNELTTGGKTERIDSQDPAKREAPDTLKDEGKPRTKGRSGAQASISGVDADHPVARRSPSRIPSSPSGGNESLGFIESDAVSTATDAIYDPERDVVQSISTDDLKDEGAHKGDSESKTEASALEGFNQEHSSHVEKDESHAADDSFSTHADEGRAADQHRYKPTTVGKPRGLKVPLEEADLSQSDFFIEQFLLSVLGPREFAVFKCFKSFYSRARETQNRTVFYRRPDLERLLGTTSSSTVTRTLKRGATLGFFEVQSFSLKINELQPGTYIHLRSPWVKK